MMSSSRRRSRVNCAMRTSIVSPWKLSSLPLKGLRRLHRRQVEQVPYETLSIHAGETWGIDPVDAVTRIDHPGRGGYCYHLNSSPVPTSKIRSSSFSKRAKTRRATGISLTTPLAGSSAWAGRNLQRRPRLRQQAPMALHLTRVELRPSRDGRPTPQRNGHHHAYRRLRHRRRTGHHVANPRRGR